MLKYNGTKWINANDADTLASLSDCSISSPSNDQVLVLTTASSLNKWIPYTISGATFNDTNKTITFAGTTSLSGLITDVSISAPPNDKQALVYNQCATKWQNTPLSSSLLSDFDTSSASNGKLLAYNLSSKWASYSL